MSPEDSTYFDYNSYAERRNIQQTNQMDSDFDVFSFGVGGGA